MHRRTAYRGLGLGPASQTIDEMNVPGAWNVGGFFLCGWEERG